MNKKIIFFLIAAVVLAAVAAAIWGLNSNKPKGLGFSDICSVGEDTKFCLAQVNRRTNDEILTISQVTNEDKQELWTELKAVLSSYYYEKNQKLPDATDYVCISVALSETELYRIEVYADLSVIVVASNDGGSYRALADTLEESKLYSRLFDIIAN